MNTVNSLVNRFTGPGEDESNRIRETRNNFISLIESNRVQYQDNKGLPEKSLTDLINLNSEYTKWLEENSTATVLEIKGKEDTYKTHVRNIIETKDVKEYYLAYIASVSAKIAESAKTRELSKDDLELMTKAVKDADTWFVKNEKTASKIEIVKKMNDFKSTIVNELKDTKLRAYYKKLFEDLEKSNPSEFKNKLEKNNEMKDQLAENEFNMNDFVNSTWDTFNTYVSYFFLIILCLFSGSLLANSVIFRPISYRVLYFIWGSIPLFIIPVFIYFILQRMRYGPLHLYTMLPIIKSTFEDEKMLGFVERMIRGPIVYFEDSNIGVFASKYQKHLEEFIQE